MQVTGSNVHPRAQLRLCVGQYFAAALATTAIRTRAGFPVASSRNKAGPLTVACRPSLIRRVFCCKFQMSAPLVPAAQFPQLLSWEEVGVPWQFPQGKPADIDER